MGRCGIACIDDLIEGRSQAPIGPDTRDAAAIAEIQDFLRCQGFSGLPGLMGSGRGVFGLKTLEAVRGFRAAHNLGEDGAVDAATLRALVESSATKPLASRTYIAFVLGIEIQGMAWIVALTSHFESARNFGALCLNTDRAGLSFGLIQWAQKPGRLIEILRAFDAADHGHFVEVFGGGNEDVAGGLLAHTAKPSGGVDAKTGAATDAAYNLIEPPWPERFRTAALHRPWQRAQCEVAVQAFSGALGRLRSSIPAIRSERAVAFLLDLANQHGEGGARSIYKAVAKPGMPEADLLAGMAEESVRRVTAQFGGGSQVVKATLDRRMFFRATEMLSARNFEDASATAQG